MCLSLYSPPTCMMMSSGDINVVLALLYLLGIVLNVHVCVQYGAPFVVLVVRM